MKKTLFVTGGMGFIGSNLILEALDRGKWKIVNIDNLAYSANPSSLAQVAGNPDYHFEKADIRNAAAIRKLFEKWQPDAIMHLAAESHVDRSIDGPGDFIQTNVNGTFTLLEEARRYWKKLQKNEPEKAAAFRFHHISTDEVFGDLSGRGEDACFSESTPYQPSSPYSASKAASDHLVRAWFHTYSLPVIITNCSNNYGPRQFPEKLIPLMILNALDGKPLPVYGKGLQIRDWLHVSDHVDALFLALEKGKPGETYVIGGHNEKANIDVVKAICEIMEKLAPGKPAGVGQYSDLITFVEDRPGHDGRYGIDAAKISSELGWRPKHDFASGLEQTVQWYLDNTDWWREIQDGRYHGQRLGLGA